MTWREIYVRPSSSTVQSRLPDLCAREVFHSGEVHRVSRMLDNLKFSISFLLGLLSCVASSPSLNIRIFHDNALHTQFLIVVGLGDRSFGMRIVMTDSGRCISSSHGRQGIADWVKHELKCIKHKPKQWITSRPKRCNPQCGPVQDAGR